MLLCLHRPRRVELVRQLVWNLSRRFTETSPHHSMFWSFKPYIYRYSCINMCTRRTSHWHAHARKSISIFDINICTYIQIFYLYTCILSIYIHIHSMCMDIGAAIPFEENARLAITESYLSCTPNAPLIWRASMHGDVPQQCLAIWFEVVCTWVASSMITCPRELVVLDVKKGALGCLLNLFKICNKHVVWPRNK